jgi:hypothetical protein
MAREQKERPRPHGDPMEESLGTRPTEDLVNNDPEENAAQRQSDAPPDETVRGNGIPALDEADGERRKKQYEDGAGIVSRID